MQPYKKFTIIVGTCPEIIKISPVVRECEKRGLDYLILHTGQHYSYSLEKIFFEELELPGAKYNLDVGSGTHAEETGKMLRGIERVLLDERPDVVLVEGDTNSVLVVALSAGYAEVVGTNANNILEKISNFSDNLKLSMDSCPFGYGMAILSVLEEDHDG